MCQHHLHLHILATHACLHIQLAYRPDVPKKWNPLWAERQRDSQRNSEHSHLKSPALNQNGYNVYVKTLKYKKTNINLYQMTIERLSSVR